MKILQNIFLFFYLFIFLRSALLYLLCSHFLFKNYSFPVVYSHSYYAVHCHINYAGTFKLSGWSDTVGRASLLSSVWSETAVVFPSKSFSFLKQFDLWIWDLFGSLAGLQLSIPPQNCTWKFHYTKLYPFASFVTLNNWFSPLFTFLC